MILKKYSKNFARLILGRSERNIADSLYFVSLSIGLIQVYQIDVGQLSLFSLIGLLPNLLAVFYGGFFNRIKRDKFWLVIFQISQLLLIVSTIVCLAYRLPVAIMYGLNFLFSLSTNLLNTLQMKIVPVSLENDEELINSSIDIQYFSSNLLDILSNFLASLLLGFLSYLALFELSIPFFIAAIYFMLKIQLPRFEAHNRDLDSEEEKSSGAFLETLAAFRESKFASFIVLTESILSGGTDLLLTLAPLYLLAEGIPIQSIGLVLAVQRFADLLGASLAPKVKISYRTFFYLDYLLSGGLLLLVFLVPNPWFKLLCFALGFMIIGISGNMFEKMIYAEYDYDKMGLIYSTNSSLYACFAIIFLLVPNFIDNIGFLGLVINGFTCLVGVYLLLQDRFSKEKKK